MPVINMDIEDLSRLCGEGFSLEEFASEIPMIGATVEKMERGEISVEFFPNRPDLFSVEGVARAYRDMVAQDPTSKERYVITGDSGIVLNVMKGVSTIRPIIGAAVVKGADIDEPALLSIMNLQEKLHITLGRKRAKVAIGIHDLTTVEPPFAYDSYEPSGISFEPLGKNGEWDLKRILEEHEKGTAYAWTLQEHDRYPVITDARGRVLSFPPIINGELTRLRTGKRDIFIDVTGTDRNAVSLALNIVCSQLMDRGGALFSVEVRYPPVEPYLSGGMEAISWPEYSWTRAELDPEYASGWLGRELDQEAISKALMRMGFRDIERNGDMISSSVPPWRADILHEADIVEDIAIGLGFSSFPGSLPTEHTTASERSITTLSRVLREIMIGLGFLEARTISLSNESDQLEMMGREDCPLPRIINPITTEHTTVRMSAIPSLLRLLSMNRHRDMPQRLFEVADVMVGNRSMKVLTLVSEDIKASFTEIKGIARRLLSDLDMDPLLLPSSMGCYIRGRSGAYMVAKGEGDYSGPFPELVTDEAWPLLHFGEVRPAVLTDLQLTMPVSALEMDLTLLDIIIDRAL